MGKPKLRIVEEAPADVTALLRKDIEARDWSKVHIAADRREPVIIPDRIKRTWL